MFALALIMLTVPLGDIPPRRGYCTYPEDDSWLNPKNTTEQNVQIKSEGARWCRDSEANFPTSKLWQNPCHKHNLNIINDDHVFHCYFGPWADIRRPSKRHPWWATFIAPEKWHRDHFWGPPPYQYERMACVNGAGWKSYDKLEGCHAEALQAYDERIREWRFITEANYPMDRLDVSQTPWWWPERYNDWLPPMPDLDEAWRKQEYVEMFGFWPPVGSCDWYEPTLCTPYERGDL